MTQEVFSLISKLKHLPEDEFKKLFFSEFSRLSLRSLSEFRKSVHFDETHEVDKTALELQLGLPTELIPIKNSGAGDCLFKAISQSLYGTEDNHHNLRLQVFIWMLKNTETVVKIKEKYKYFVSDSVFSLTLQVGVPQTWMGVAHIACSAMALKVHISTFYPFVNGLENTTAKVLNTIYNCEAVGSEVIINIQWSSIIFDKTKRYWQPNHFVSLVDKTKKNYNFNINSDGVILLDNDENDKDEFVNDSDDKKNICKEAKIKPSIKTVDIKKQNKINKAPQSFPSYDSDENDFVNNADYKEFKSNYSKTKNNLKTVHGQKENNKGNNIEQSVSIEDTKTMN